MATQDLGVVSGNVPALRRRERPDQLEADEAGTGHSVSDAVGALWDDCERAMPTSDFSEIWTFVAGDRA